MTIEQETKLDDALASIALHRRHVLKHMRAPAGTIDFDAYGGADESTLVQSTFDSVAQEQKEDVKTRIVNRMKRQFRNQKVTSKWKVLDKLPLVKEIVAKAVEKGVLPMAVGKVDDMLENVNDGVSKVGVQATVSLATWHTFVRFKLLPGQDEKDKSFWEMVAMEPKYAGFTKREGEDDMYIRWTKGAVA